MAKIKKQEQKVSEISIVSDFKYGYRNREDITNLPTGVLVVGSQNVLVNTASRVQVRDGYCVDGASSIVNAPIKGGYQFITKGNGERVLRTGFLTSAGNDGKMQFRYEDTAGAVTWTDLLTGLTSTSYNFTTWWDATELSRLCLFVNGSTNIYEWNGAYDTVASITSNTIVMTNAIGTSGFYSTRDKKIKIRGVEYTYTGISSSTFTGVSPDPTAQGANTPIAGDVAFQSIVTIAQASFTGTAGYIPPATFNIDLISTLNNQVYYGSTESPTVYMGALSDTKYYDFTVASPRIPGNGSKASIDDNLVAFIPQEDVMYITAGKNYWYNTKLSQSVTYNGTIAVTTETFDVKLLKSNNLQAAKSQSLVNNMGNMVIMVNNEPAFEQFGRIENILGTPQTVNLSDPIKNDFDTYDFTDGSVYSWRRYLLVAIPKSGIIRIFNLTTKAWESPQTIPVTSFYTIDGGLYGHSSITSESYELFTGKSDRMISGVGQPILANASFSYQNYGTRTEKKSFNEFYIEGYINSNTSLDCSINYELDGCMTTQTFTLDGSDKTVVCIPSDESSFGKVSFGKEKIGGDKSSSLTGLSPKFRVIKTSSRVPFYENQFSFSIFGKDQSFELIAFGANVMITPDANSDIKQ